jgi:dynein heavy chain
LHAQVQAKLDEMQAQFDAAMAQKQVGEDSVALTLCGHGSEYLCASVPVCSHAQALEDDAAATQKKMDSATALITALAGTQSHVPLSPHTADPLGSSF